MHLVPFTCLDCGKEMLIPKRASERKYCHDCSYKRHLERNRESSRKRRGWQKTEKDKKSKLPRGFTENMIAISEMEAAGRAWGVSYGKAVAMMERDGKGGIEM